MTTGRDLVRSVQLFPLELLKAMTTVRVLARRVFAWLLLERAKTSGLSLAGIRGSFFS